MVGRWVERAPWWAIRAVHAGAVLAAVSGVASRAQGGTCPQPHHPAAVMHASGHCLAPELPACMQVGTAWPQQATGWWATSPTCAASNGRVSVPSPMTRCASRVGGPLSQTVMPPCRWPQFAPRVGRPPPVATTQSRKGLSSCSSVGGWGRTGAEGKERQHAATQGEDGSCAGWGRAGGARRTCPCPDHFRLRLPDGLLPEPPLKARYPAANHGQAPPTPAARKPAKPESQHPPE